MAVRAARAHSQAAEATSGKGLKITCLPAGPALPWKRACRSIMRKTHLTLSYAEHFCDWLMGTDEAERKAEHFQNPTQSVQLSRYQDFPTTVCLVGKTSSPAHRRVHGRGW